MTDPATTLFLQDVAQAKSAIRNSLRNARRVYSKHVLTVALLDYAVSYAKENKCKVATVANLVGHVYRGTTIESALLDTLDVDEATKM